MIETTLLTQSIDTQAQLKTKGGKMEEENGYSAVEKEKMIRDAINKIYSNESEEVRDRMIRIAIEKYGK